MFTKYKDVADVYQACKNEKKEKHANSERDIDFVTGNSTQV